MRRSLSITFVLSVIILALNPLNCGFAAEALTVYAYRDYSVPSDQWCVRLQFSNPVFSDNLKSNLSVSGPTGPESFDLKIPGSTEEPTGPSNQFQIVSRGGASKPETIKIQINKGLSDSVGRRMLAKDYVYQFVSVESVSVSNVATYFKNSRDKGIRITTTDSISQAALSSNIQVVPEVANLRIKKDGYSTFSITGDFEYQKSYKLIVSQAKIDNGKAFLSAGEFAFSGPGITREIAFKSKRSVVELKGRQLVPLTLSNISKFNCSAQRILPYLLPLTSYGSDDDEHAPSDITQRSEKIKSELAKSKISPHFFGTADKNSDVFFSPEAKDSIKNYSLPLSFRKGPEKGGFWHLNLSDADANNVQTKTIVNITDLSISYKVANDVVLIWLTSINTGLPVPDVEIMAVGEKGRRFFVGKTNNDGLLLIKHENKYPSVQFGKESTGLKPAGLDIAKLDWVVAATADDSSSIHLDKFRLQTTKVTVSGSESELQGSRTGVVFTERGIYKPGETVHFKFVSRVFQDGEIVSPEKDRVKIEIINPREEVSYSKELTLGEFGSCWDSFQVKTFFPVGTYNLKVTASNKSEQSQIYSTTFQVQEFKRIRHFATLSVTKEKQRNAGFIGVNKEEEYLKVNIAGKYYTGGPVKNGLVRWKAMLVPVSNKVKGWEGFSFGYEGADSQFLESGESILDGDGKLTVTIPLDSRMLTGSFGIKISATVLDIDGEPATEVETYSPQPKYYVGLEQHPKQVDSGYSSTLKVVVVDAEGKKIGDGKIGTSILRKRYFYTEKRDEQGNLTSNYEEGWAKAYGSQQNLVKGEAFVQLDFIEGGEYLIEVQYEDVSGKYASRTLFDVGWTQDYPRNGEKADQDVRTANEIQLSSNRKEFKAGDTATVQFTVPRPVRKCLATVENGRIFDYRIVELNGSTGKFNFKVEEDFNPNIYVSVMAPAGRSGFPIYSGQVDSDVPFLYYGYINLGVRSEVTKLKLEIDPNQTELKGRPAEEKTISFKVTDQSNKGVLSEIAVCVVDEAILALTRFQTPDLSPLLNFTLPLIVQSGDLRLDLISQDLFRILMTKPLTGGGAGLGEVSPSLRKDFRPVAYYTPALLTDKNGNASVTFKLPDTTTSYRIYAVVSDKTAGFVSGKRNMIVTKEFFIEPSLPRFLVVGDKGKFPITANNKTSGAGQFTVMANSTPKIQIGLDEKPSPLAANSESVIWGSAEAKGITTQEKIVFEGLFKTEIGDFKDAVQHTIPIYSKFLTIRSAQSAEISSTGEIKAAFPDALRKLDPSVLETTNLTARLNLSGTNWSRLVPSIKYLINYPYGCVEQTSSGVIPLAAVKSLVENNVIPGLNSEEIDKFLKAGINRLLSMQQANGGFSYWPDQTEISWWGSLYATYALTIAEQFQIDVPADRLQKAREFIKDRLFKKDVVETRGSDPEWTRELAIFNLAAGKMLTPEQFTEFMKNFEKLGNQGKAFLVLSGLHSGQISRKDAADLFAKIDPKFDVIRTNYRDSTYREIAVALMAGLSAEASRSALDNLAGFLLRSLKPDGRWSSTADTGWCLLALSKYYEQFHSTKTVSSKISVTALGNRTEIVLGDVDQDIEFDAKKLLENPVIQINADSKQLIHAMLFLTYPEISESTKSGSMFTINKNIANLNGQEEIRIGDVVRVTLELGLDPQRKDASREFEYLVLEDPVPAGLVPVNSELKTEGVENNSTSAEGEGDYSRMSFVPSYFELRDDGVRVFKNKAAAGLYKYSYLARAVTEGEFFMRSSRIGLMYEPDKSGVLEGKIVKIQPQAR